MLWLASSSTVTRSGQFRRVRRTGGEARRESGSADCRSASSLPPGPAQDRRQGPGDDLEVQPEGPSVDVVEVLLHPVVELRAVARAYLPEPGDARLHRQPAAVPRVVVGDLARQRRAWAHKTHLAPQYVPQLGQLIERRSAQETPDTRDPGIVR